MLATIERKWSQDSRIDAFRIYFFKQWIHSQYSKWQLFRSPPGYCSTNSPIEGNNNTIKQQYFVESFSYNMLPATDVEFIIQISYFIEFIFPYISNTLFSFIVVMNK